MAGFFFARRMSVEKLATAEGISTKNDLEFFVRLGRRLTLYSSTTALVGTATVFLLVRR